MILIDTDVLVECLRGSATAKTWLGTLHKDAFSIPGVVAMELVLSSFNVVWPDASEFARSYSILLTLRLSSGLGIPDCLIAAMAVARGARPYTFNLKHFQVVPGLDTQQPYPRPTGSGA